MVYLFDSHCHLQDDRIVGAIEAVIARANDHGVERILCCGSSEADWPAVIDIFRQYPTIVVPALGLHPWYVTSRSTVWMETLTRMLEENALVAIGEIGLDHSLVPRNDTEQLEAFYRQLLLAVNFDRPVSVHCRKAWGTLLDLFRRHPGIARRAVIHSYSGPPEIIDELQHHGVSISFSGSITYLNNTRGRNAAVKVDINRLLVETDSPDIVPLHHVAPNEPGTLPEVVEAIAALRSVSVGEIADVTWANGCRLFGVPSTAALQ